MNALILSLHITVASLLTLTAAGVLVAAWRQQKTKVYGVMMTSFAGTVLSGTALLFVGIGGIGRICATMTTVTFATLLISRYYRARIASLTV